jgi:hypothetical protein
LRIEADGLGVIGVGADEVVLPAIGDATVVVDGGQIGAAVLSGASKTRARLRPQRRLGSIVAAHLRIVRGRDAAKRHRHGKSKPDRTQRKISPVTNH